MEVRQSFDFMRFYRSPLSAKRRNVILLTIVGIGVLVLAAGVLLPVFGHVAFVDPLLSQAFRLKTLGDLLRLHAGENDGRFPAKVSDLITEHLSGNDNDILKFHDLRTKEPIDWTYFGGYSTSDPGGTILVASPKTFSKADGTRLVGAGVFRIVLSVDGRMALLTEPDYQTCIAEQQHPGWSTNQSTPPTWDLLSAVRENARAIAIAADARIKAKSAKDISRFIEVLKTGDDRARSEAADSLGKIGAVPREAVPALVAGLDSRDVGYSAESTLVKISLYDERVVPALLDVLRSGKNQASEWAVVALGEIGPPDDAAIPLLIPKLESSSSDMRTEATKAVGSLGPVAAKAVPSLIRRLSDDDAWTVKCAAVALGRIGPEAREAIPALTARFQAGGDYQIDMARALWKIDPTQGPLIVPVLIAALDSQRNSDRPNHQMTYDFFSAIDLLGEIGPEARAAIPVLKTNLQGDAWMQAAWALWHIDPMFKEVATPMLLRFLDEKESADRLDRMAQGTQFARSALAPRKNIFGRPFGPRLAAAGMLWQMHPDKQEALRPFIAALLHEWQKNRVLKELTPDTRAAIPALTEIEKDPAYPDPRLIAKAALRKIATTDYGEW
jgi:HEAT repeat protein